MKAYWDPELETMPWEELLRWQAGQAGPWLAALPERWRFHRERLAGARVPEWVADPGFLADLPFTTKDEIRASQEDAGPGKPFGRHQGVPLSGVIQVLSSSGTTGDPLNFALTAADLEVWRDGIATGFYTAGIRGHDVVAHLVGLPGVAGGLPVRRRVPPHRRGAGLDRRAPHRADRPVHPAVQATAVLATSSFGTYLADRCRDLTGSDAASLGVRTLLGGGEPGLAQPEIREKIRRGWGLDRVHEVMGLGDVMSLLWAECDDEGGMHFCGQRSVTVELVDPASGAAVGVAGRRRGRGRLHHLRP